MYYVRYLMLILFFLFDIHSFFLFFFFFFNDTATTEIYTLSLHDALPIWIPRRTWIPGRGSSGWRPPAPRRSEEHTSELQSRFDLVCRLLLEKKKKKNKKHHQQKHRKPEPTQTWQLDDTLSTTKLRKSHPH